MPTLQTQVQRFCMKEESTRNSNFTMGSPEAASGLIPPTSTGIDPIASEVQLRSDVDDEMSDLPETGDESPRKAFYESLDAMDGTERKAQMAKALQTLEEEIDRIPTQDKSAYLRAIEECPKEAKAKRRRTAFLERECLDPKLAAERMVRYWEERLDLFGPDRCFLPMTLHGALKDEVQGIISFPINSVLPNKDADGKTIIYSDPDLRDFSKYPQRSEAIALWYMLETTFEDRRNGLVFVSSTIGNNSEQTSSSSSGGSFNNSSTSSGTSLSNGGRSSFDEVFPLWFSRMHSCMVERMDDSNVLPNFDYIFNKENQDRVKIHIGPLPDILQTLEDYSLSREILPAAMGGSIGLNSQHWVHERLAKEYADAAKIRDARDRSNRTHAASFSTAAIAPTWEPTIERYGSYEYIPKPPTEALDVDESVLLQKTGRKADNRMNRATLAKLRNPLLSRRDALMIGGYVYPEEETGKSTNKLFDAEGVSLYQRMNHLNRRVKQVREKLAREKDPNAKFKRNKRRKT